MMRVFLFPLLIVSLVGAVTIDELISMSVESPAAAEMIQDDDTVLVELDMLFKADKWEAIQRLADARKSRFRYRRMSREKRKADRIRAGVQRWPQKEVPYQISEYDYFAASHKYQIESAIKSWNTFTCVNLRPATDSDRHRLNIRNGQGCSSYIGYTPNSNQEKSSQPVNLATGCRIKGIIAHELGHALGLYHEQSRPDRDNYVKINEDKIVQELLYNFRSYPEDVIDTHDVPYDYMSIMHYGKTAFSSDRTSITIETKDPAYQDKIGNRLELSFADIAVMNKMYGCNSHCRPVACPDRGYQGKDCKCYCLGKSINEPVLLCTQPTTTTTTTTTTTVPTTTTTTAKVVTQPGETTTTSTTTTVATTTASTAMKPRECKNLSGSCGLWSYMGFCRIPKFRSYMIMVCTKACGACKKTTTAPVPIPVCKNRNKYCSYWARKKRYCRKRSRWYNYMRSNCPLACRFCSASREPSAVTTKKTTFEVPPRRLGPASINMAIKERQRAELICKVVSEGPVTFQWLVKMKKKKGKKKDRGDAGPQVRLGRDKYKYLHENVKAESDGNKVYIDVHVVFRMSKEDEGRYVCKASNGNGKPAMTAYHIRMKKGRGRGGGGRGRGRGYE